MFRVTTTIDLTKTVFSSDDAQHVAELERLISEFRSTGTALLKIDVAISAVTALVGLVMLFAPLMIDICIIGLTLAIGFATDVLSKRQLASDNYQDALHNLVQVYRVNASADNDYQALAAPSLAKLLETIAPYVETGVLWSMSGAGKGKYPETYIKVLSTHPHRLPFMTIETEKPNAIGMMQLATEVIGKLLPISAANPMPQVLEGVPKSTLRTTVRLFKQVKADVNQTVYGLERRLKL